MLNSRELECSIIREIEHHYHRAQKHIISFIHLVALYFNIVDSIQISKIESDDASPYGGLHQRVKLLSHNQHPQQLFLPLNLHLLETMLPDSDVWSNTVLTVVHENDPVKICKRVF